MAHAGGVPPGSGLSGRSAAAVAWNSAPDDPQLRILHVYVAAFKAAVSSGRNIARGLDVDGMVQRAFSAHADQEHPHGS